MIVASSQGGVDIESVGLIWNAFICACFASLMLLTL